MLWAGLATPGWCAFSEKPRVSAPIRLLGEGFERWWHLDAGEFETVGRGRRREGIFQRRVTVVSAKEQSEKLMAFSAQTGSEVRL